MRQTISKHWPLAIALVAAIVLFVWLMLVSPSTSNIFRILGRLLVCAFVGLVVFALIHYGTKLLDWLANR